MEPRERCLITAGTASQNVLLLLPCSSGNPAPDPSTDPSPRALPGTLLTTSLQHPSAQNSVILPRSALKKEPPQWNKPAPHNSRKKHSGF